MDFFDTLEYFNPLRINNLIILMSVVLQQHLLLSILIILVF